MADHPHPLTGADVPAAIRALYPDGLSTPRRVLDVELAFSLGVSARTVRRWRTGRGRPSLDNFDRLRQYVGDCRAALLARSDVYRRPRLRAALARTQQAHDALRTDADRAEADRLAADIRTHLSALRAVNGV